MGIKPYFLAAVFLIFSVFSLYAQTDRSENAAVPAETAGTEYVIREMEFDTIGRTRPYFIVTYGEFEEGERIRGKENFDKYLAEKTQLLNNQRVLDAEATKIEYTLGEPESDGVLPIKLIIHTKDTWNFIIAPYPQHDSNSGTKITLKIRDYNFLGTMNPLRVDVGYQYDGTNHFNFLLDSDTPFEALGLDWNVNFDNNFNYTFDKPLYYQNTTGLSVKLPAGFTNVTIGFNQYTTVNEEISSGNREKYYIPISDTYYSPYTSTELYASWGIPLGIEVGKFGELTYSPGLSGRINYPYGSMDAPRKPKTTLSHSIGFGRVDWIGNYRKGLSVSIGNSYSWSFDRDDAPFEASLDAGGMIYWPFSRYFGVYSRLKYRHWWHWSDRNNDWLSYYSAGDLIRGVINDDLRARYMFSLNLDLPVKVLRFWPSEWLNNSKLHLFDFEMFFSPFTDVALLDGPYNRLKENANEGIKFSLDDIVHTVGLEVVVFSGFFRSLRLRGSVGYNVQKIRENGLPPLKWGFFPQWNEIYIGLEHHF